MKILCVIDSLGSGGAQRQLVELAIGFKERGHDVSFLVYHDENFFRKPLDEVGIPVISIIEPKYLIRLIKIRRFIRRGSFDSVLSFLEAPNFICEISGIPWRRWRLIVGERSANPQILRSIKLISFRWFHLLADKVISNSHENDLWIKKANPLLGRNKCVVLYNIVDLNKWNHFNTDSTQGGNVINILVASSHGENKNLEGLVRALALLSDDLRQIIHIMWFGGRGNTDITPRIRGLISSNNLNKTIVFYPATDELEKHYARIDVVGLFSFYEGLPNSICEGMAAGKPIIASNVSDIPLLVENKRLLFNPRDSESIVAAIKFLISLNREDLIKEGQKNKRKAVSLFNKGSIINEYLRLLKNN